MLKKSIRLSGFTWGEYSLARLKQGKLGAADYFIKRSFALLKEKAREVRHWNTLRECDLFLAIAKKIGIKVRQLVLIVK